MARLAGRIEGPPGDHLQQYGEADPGHPGARADEDGVVEDMEHILRSTPSQAPAQLLGRPGGGMSEGARERAVRQPLLQTSTSQQVPSDGVVFMAARPGSREQEPEGQGFESSPTHRLDHPRG